MTRRCAVWGLLALAVLALRVGAIHTESGNWDEFALLHHASATASTGELQSGGRPGLAVLLLLPLVERCADEIAVLREARLVWLGVTAAALAALAMLVARLGGGRRWGDAALAVALLAAVPAFLTWSLQVRTDQLALCAGLWGAVALVESRRRRVWALVGGALLAIGWLATPKVVYVAALAGVLVLGDAWLARAFGLRRDAWRAGLAALAAVAVLALYRFGVSQVFPGPGELLAGGRGVTLSHGISVFEFYRATIGWSQYVALLPGLVPHAALAVGLAMASARSWREAEPFDRRLALAWVVLVLGVAVLLFHAAAFRYFWMTLGLFPAVALAVAREPVLALFDAHPARLRRIAATAFCAVLALPAISESAALLVDTQAVQRESLGFVQRNFGPQDAGFQPEGALFCREGEDPFPVFFSQTLYYRFGRDADRRERQIDALVGAFRARPVKYLLESWRLQQFPSEVQAFWADHYLPYADSVYVAGRRLRGTRDSRDTFEILVPGRYRWLPYDAPRPIAIDGVRLEPGQEIDLAAGRHEVGFVEDVSLGILALALADLPSDPRPFYRAY